MNPARVVRVPLEAERDYLARMDDDDRMIMNVLLILYEFNCIIGFDDSIWNL